MNTKKLPPEEIKTRYARVFAYMRIFLPILIAGILVPNAVQWWVNNAPADPPGILYWILMSLSAVAVLGSALILLVVFRCPECGATLHPAYNPERCKTCGARLRD